ncbi:MAG: mechanosensitive ion channel family protein, partial [Caulobacteraceae bacterium]
GLVGSLAILVAAIVVARLVATGVRRIRGRLPDGGTALYIVEKLSGYAIFLIGLAVALSTLGLNLSSLAVFAGALGVGVGLGLQGVVKQFVSGLVLIFDSVLNVGDYVELPGSGGVRGQVAEIGPRATRIRTNDRVDILIPNSTLIEDRFVNWTLHGETRRIHVPFSVAYGADKARVRDAVLAAARGMSITLPDEGSRRAQVWLVGFGESALNFELVVWPTLDAVKRPASMMAAYTWAIEDALRSQGIEVPFPQLDLRLRSVLGREGDAGLEALGFGAKAERAPRPKAARRADVNDAAQDLLEPEDPPESEDPPSS